MNYRSVADIRAEFKKGDKIKIVSMDDEPDYAGREGTVTTVDDRGQIHGTWGSCAIIPEIDEFYKIG